MTACHSLIMNTTTPRRSNGVQAANYVLHVPNAIVGGPVGKTVCGRVAANVNCIAGRNEINASDLCRACSKWTIRLESER